MLRTALLPCLACTLLATAADAQTQPQARRLQDVVLDSGLTLDDWVRVTRSKEPTPSVATGAQAAAFVRRYGPYRELLDIVWRAARHPNLAREGISRENAAERVVALTEARRQLGDWPSLLMSSATAKAYLGDDAGATADLRRWLAASPSTDAQRTTVAETLLAAEQNADAVKTWLTRTGPAAIPPHLRREVDPHFERYAKEMVEALRCLGSPSRYDDLDVVYSGVGDLGVDYVWRESWRVTKSGLTSTNSDLDRLLSRGRDRVFQYKDKLTAASGPFWGRSKWSDGQDSGEASQSSSAIACSTTLLPASKGKVYSVTFEVDSQSSSSPPTKYRAIASNRLTLEILSDGLTLQETLAAQANLRSELPADIGWRFFLARMTAEYESRWVEHVDPFSSKGAALPSNPPPQREVLDAVFIDGPNALVVYGAAVKKLSLGPGWTWTVSFPPRK